MTLPRNVGLGVVLWMQGMVVGSVVLAVPALKALGPIPWISANPIITVTMLMLWPLTLRWFTRGRPRAEALRIGLVCLLVSLSLDAAVMLGVLGATGFFGYAGLWAGYASLVVVPALRV